MDWFRAGEVQELGPGCGIDDACVATAHAVHDGRSERGETAHCLAQVVTPRAFECNVDAGSGRECTYLSVPAGRGVDGMIGAELERSSTLGRCAGGGDDGSSPEQLCYLDRVGADPAGCSGDEDTLTRLEFRRLRE